MGEAKCSSLEHNTYAVFTNVTTRVYMNLRIRCKTMSVGTEPCNVKNFEKNTRRATIVAAYTAMPKVVGYLSA